MKFIIIVGLYVFFPMLSSANITLNVVAPTQHQVVGNVLNIKIKITSTYEIANVSAAVVGRQTILNYNLQSLSFEGTLSLAGLMEGDTFDLNIIATDVYNNQQSVDKKIIYDNPPLVYFDLPLNQSVFRPDLLFKVRVMDNDSSLCRVRYKVGLGGTETYLFSGMVKDSLNMILSAPVSYSGRTGFVEFSATDKWGQTTSAFRQTIYTDASPFLKEIYGGETPIIDFNYNKVLLEGDSAISYPLIADVITNQKTVVPLKIQLAGKSFLTSDGAVFSGQDSSRATSNSNYPRYVYDWNFNNTYFLGNLNENNSLNVKGIFASWSNGSNLYLRNLHTKSTSLISSSAGNIYNDIAYNGAVAYWSNSYNINFSLNGTNNVLTTNAGNKWNTYPLTDGTNVVYRKSDPCCNNQLYSINFYDGNSHIQLSDLGTVQPYPKMNYQVNNKFTSYTKFGTSGQAQVWLRDSLGNNTQVSFFGTSSHLDLMNRKGDIIFTNDNRYLVVKSGHPLAISSNLGTLYDRDSSWYIAIGRMLYKVDLTTPLPIKLSSFIAASQGNSNHLKWATAEEINTSHFEIEASVNEKDFNVIGRLPAVGRKSNYSFIDKMPQPIKNYYRLKLVDKDGRFEYSQIRIVNNYKSISITVNPNPVSTTLNVTINSQRINTASVQVVSVSGKVFLSEQFSLQQGVVIKKIDISGLSKGSYLLKVQLLSKEQIVTKFQKL